MITEEMITVVTKPAGLYLAAETPTGNYGQYYNTTTPARPSFVKSVKEAKQRFVAFYNKFERGQTWF